MPPPPSFRRSLDSPPTLHYIARRGYPAAHPKATYDTLLETRPENDGDLQVIRISHAAAEIDASPPKIGPVVFQIKVSAVRIDSSAPLESTLTSDAATGSPWLVSCSPPSQGPQPSATKGSCDGSSSRTFPCCRARAHNRPRSRRTLLAEKGPRTGAPPARLHEVAQAELYCSQQG